jgi:hypothetical protein
LNFTDKLLSKYGKSAAISLYTAPFVSPSVIALGIGVGGSKMIIDEQRKLVYDRQLKRRYGLVPDRNTREYKNLISKPQYCVIRTKKIDWSKLLRS